MPNPRHYQTMIGPCYHPLRLFRGITIKCTGHEAAIGLLALIDLSKQPDQACPKSLDISGSCCRGNRCTKYHSMLLHTTPYRSQPHSATLSHPLPPNTTPYHSIPHSATLSHAPPRVVRNQALIAPKSPQGVLVRGQAGLVINKLLHPIPRSDPHELWVVGNRTAWEQDEPGGGRAPPTQVSQREYVLRAVLSFLGHLV